MTDCIFCRIAAGAIPADIVYQDDDVVAFRDIHPVAPVHLLIVPRKHVANLLELAGHPDGVSLAQAVLRAVPRVAAAAGVDQTGFRLINNCGEDGGQTISHVHFHLIGGRSLGEKLL
ncbi:MAG: HIT domain-containing protein [Clostridiaceae bacterium]|jgi:histidine triad (HIT) family protein|nr:HIT domain-containing protein [Clostridiaceae bacterium]